MELGAVSPVSLVQPDVNTPMWGGASVPPEEPALTVIVPVCNGAAYLAASLIALRASELLPARWELIVVDDSSADGSAEVAARYADRVVALEHGPRGAAFARNRGADLARGAVLLFVDADVCVHPDCLGRVLEALEQQPAISAVFGAYDLRPTATGLVSQYRNLLHRYVHERDAGDAVTFWSGCGAVRTAVFRDIGGFDEGRGREAMEDIDLGYRMTSLGHRIVIRPEIQATHLKRWTLRSMIVTDVWRRGVPWLRLLLSGKVRSRATLNIRASERTCTGLVFLGCLASLASLLSGRYIWLAIAALTVGAIVAINGPLLAWFAHHRGWWFSLRIIPLRLLYYVLNAASVLLAVAAFVVGPRRTRAPPKLASGRASPST